MREMSISGADCVLDMLFSLEIFRFVRRMGLGTWDSRKFWKYFVYSCIIETYVKRGSGRQKEG